MSAGKRPASNSFGSSQMVVKRQKSNSDLGNGNAVALTNSSAGNGALIQAVSLHGYGSQPQDASRGCTEQVFKGGRLMER